MALDKTLFGPDNLPAYIGGPDGAPGVIVLQEWWGITDEIKEQASHIVEQGYRVLVPDLYKGKLGVDKEEAHHLMSNLDFKQAVKEITQAVDYLKETGSAKVGVIGFCMGGALSLAAAQHSGVASAAPFYGIPSPEICDPTQINIPVEGHFGEDDAMTGFSDKASALALEGQLKKSRNPDACCVYLYPGESHAFMNPVNESTKQKRASLGMKEPKAENQELAWKRVFDFFAKTLKTA